MRRLLLRIIPIILFGILCTCIIYYSIQYSNLNIDQKLNFTKDWNWIILDPYIIASVSLDVSAIWKNSKMFGNIEYRAKTSISRLLILMVASLGVSLILIEFFTYPSFSSLSMNIIILYGLLKASFSVIIGTGVGRKGIVSFGNYYFWDDIKSLSWNSDGKQLITRFFRKDALIFKVGKVKIRVKEYDKPFVKGLLKLRIEKPELL